jgi:hypothetical protein
LSGEILAGPKSRIRLVTTSGPDAPSRPFVATFLRGGPRDWLDAGVIAQSSPTGQAGALSRGRVATNCRAGANACLPQGGCGAIDHVARPRSMLRKKRLQRDCVGETLLAVRVCSRLRPPTDDYGSNIGRCNLGSARCTRGGLAQSSTNSFFFRQTAARKRRGARTGARRRQTRTLGG